MSQIKANIFRQFFCISIIFVTFAPKQECKGYGKKRRRTEMA